MTDISHDAFSPAQRKAIEIALTHSIPFVCYALPGTSRALFRCSASVSAPSVSGDPCNRTESTFHPDLLRIVPWNSPLASATSIHLSTDEHALLADPDSCNDSHGTPFQAPWQKSTPRQSYLESVRSVISSLSGNPDPDASKVVISRVLCGSLPDFSVSRLIEIAGRAFTDRTSSFRYLLFSPAVGIWIGSTPELLADIDIPSRRLSTVALAGTRLRSVDKPWDAKNVREQAIVTDFILDALSSAGCSPLASSPRTLPYGSIEHIATDITATLSSDDPAGILDTLSPTPALAGYPRVEALQAISEVESHPRRLYGGYLALSSASRILAFVNIRCMQLDLHGNYCLYGGGGILPDSVPEDEWDETAAKMNNLLNLLS
ncbi:MAG: chorismate-binding protein [Muribaculaceae bacterium]|nr:chorismate-binding protein [Muribaculaceae bacterium]